jgi:hypothetical protein
VQFVEVVLAAEELANEKRGEGDIDLARWWVGVLVTSMATGVAARKCRS